MKSLRLLGIVALSLVSTAALADNPHVNTIPHSAQYSQRVLGQVAFAGQDGSETGLPVITYDRSTVIDAPSLNHR